MAKQSGFVKEFLSRGFAVRKKVIPRNVCERALARANETLIANMKLALGEIFDGSNADTRTRLKKEHEGIQHYHSVVAANYSAELNAAGEYVQEVVEELLGADQALEMQRQITTAAPVLDYPRKGSQGWHIDYLHRMVENGTFYDFPPYAVIAGVNLSPFPARRGNLIVHPGAHHTVAQFLKQQGESRATFEMLRHGNLLGLEFPEPRFVVTGNVGDIVVMHPLMPHDIGQNHGPNLQIKAYYRYQSKRLVAKRRTVGGLIGQ